MTYGRDRDQIQADLDLFVKLRSEQDDPDKDPRFCDLEIKAARDCAESAMEDADWLCEVEEPFTPHVDAAKAVVFQALALKRLTAMGWLEFTAEEKAESAKHYPDRGPLVGGPDGRFVEIPAAAWSLDGFDWGECTLTTRQCEYRAVQCKSDDVRVIFPHPQCDFEVKKLKIFPSIAIIEDGNVGFVDENTVRRNRGRPTKGPHNIDIRTVVQNYFGPAIRCSDTGSKREAFVAEVMDFVKRAFHVDISRTTAQSYIAPLWGVALNSVPGIAGRK